MTKPKQWRTHASYWTLKLLGRHRTITRFSKSRWCALSNLNFKYEKNYRIVKKTIIVLQKTRVFLPIQVVQAKKLKYFKLFHKTNAIAKKSGFFICHTSDEIIQKYCRVQNLLSRLFKLWNCKTFQDFSVSISVGRKFKFFYWWHSGFETTQS